MAESQSNLSELTEARVTFNLEGSESSNSTEANSAESGFSEHKVEKTYASVCSSCQGEMKPQQQSPLNNTTRSRHHSDGGIPSRAAAHRLGRDTESEGARYHRGRGHYRGQGETRHEGYFDRGKQSRRYSDRGGIHHELKREERYYRERSNSAGSGGQFRGPNRRGNYERRPFSTGSRGTGRGRPYRGGAHDTRRQGGEDFQRSFSDPRVRSDNLGVPDYDRNANSDGVGRGYRRGGWGREGGVSDQSVEDTDGGVGPRGRINRGGGGLTRRGSVPRGKYDR